MKTKLLTLIFFITYSHLLFAQTDGEEKKHRFSIGVEGGAIYTLFSPDQMDNLIIDGWGADIQWASHWEVGLKSKLDLTERWAFSIGGIYENIGVHSIENFYYKDKVSGVIFYRTLTTHYDEIAHAVSIPMILEYNSGKRKVKSAIGFGFSPFLVLAEQDSVRIIQYEIKPYYSDGWSNTPPYAPLINTINLSAVFSAGIQYSLSNHINLSAASQINYYILKRKFYPREIDVALLCGIQFKL